MIYWNGIAKNEIIAERVSFVKFRSFLLCLLLVSLLAVPAAASDQITVTVNGTVIHFDQNPIIENDRTLVPVRFIFEALGATVDWEGSSETVTAYKDNSWVALQIGSYRMIQDGKTIWLDAAPRLLNNRTLVPLRAVSEAFGAMVDWIGETQTVVITTDQSTPEATPGIGQHEFEQQVLTLVNQEREQRGLQPLVWNDQLAQVARAHSKDMSDRNFMSHTNPDGLSPFDRIKNSGIRYSMAAENIAAGQTTPQAVMESWMNSAGHRENILNPNLTELGVGFYQGNSGYRYYWTQCFITPA